jgi:MoaA/NifB/PqqE/SkfB family radical SAM enzyme
MRGDTPLPDARDSPPRLPFKGDARRSRVRRKQISMKRLSTLLTLTRNAIRYRLSRRTGGSCPIQAISLEITHRCIARCVMCNIWRIPPTVQDLPSSIWMRLLRSPALKDLREVDVTGGEPFLRQDLGDLVMTIAGQKASHTPHVRTVAITTNGFLTRRILKVTSEMAETLGNNGIDLVFALAMDGVGDIHDTIRGTKGCWNKLNSTIKGLCELRERFPNLVMGIKTTVLPMNVDELDSIAHYAKERGLFTIISPWIRTGVRYANLGQGADLQFSDADLEKLVRFYSSDLFRWSYHRKVLMDLLRDRIVKKPCTVGFNYFFVRSTGDVYPCPLINRCIGNIQDEPLENLIRGQEAVRFRKTSRTHKECHTCTEPGLERYSLAFEGITYAGLLLRMRHQDFAQFHMHLGLNKYFD